MLIQADEKSVALTPFGSLALNGAANASKRGDQSWIEIIRSALRTISKLRVMPAPKKDIA